MVEKLAVEVALNVTGVDEAAKSFQQATKSIAALGSTGKEALQGAADAAKKFGASASELAGVESVIKAINARANDSSTSFSELAKNYDAARQAARSFVTAAEKVEQATNKTGASASEARSAVNALAQGLNEMGAGPLGRLASAITNIGTRFGALAIAVAAVGGSAAALIKFARAAEETEKALTQLQKVSGQSFTSLSALATVFAKSGTPLKQFASEFGNLSEKIAAAGEQAAKQDAIKKQAEDAAKGLKVTELGAITLDERVKALLETLSRVPATQQWFALADVFKNLGNTVERARLGQALGLSPESIATLSQGADKLRELQAEAERLGLTLTSSNQSALQEMAAQWNQFNALLSVFFEKIGAAFAPVVNQILRSFTQVMQQIAADFQNLPLDQAIGNLGNRLAPAFNAMGQILLPIVIQIGIALGKAIIEGMSAALQQGAGPAIQSIFSNLPFSWAVNLGLAIGRAIVAGAKQASPAASGDSGGAPAKARGGLLGGIGSGTSDSNLAWVSRGEHIMPAAAVAQPGVLAFLEALRRSGGNLRGVLDVIIPAFAKGGSVKKSVPAISNLEDVFETKFNAIAELVNNAATALEDFRSMPIDQNAQNLQAAITDIATNLPEVQKLADSLKSIPQVGDAMGRLTTGLVETVIVAKKVLNDFDQDNQFLDNLLNNLKSLRSLGGAVSAAGGGLLGGRGTGTSDSNLAWVSRGEYIIPARAVAGSGVLAFLEALRRSGGNLTAVLNGMGRFALGGMVPRPAMAFASGGLAGGMSNVTIQFPGLPAIGGLRASSDVVDQLHRAAALAQVRSGGRKPSRYS